LKEKNGINSLTVFEIKIRTQFGMKNSDEKIVCESKNKDIFLLELTQETSEWMLELLNQVVR
jgi:hypothetical protein